MSLSPLSLLMDPPTGSRGLASSCAEMGRPRDASRVDALRPKYLRLREM